MTRGAQWAEWLLGVRQRLANQPNAPGWWMRHEPWVDRGQWPGFRDWSLEELRRVQPNCLIQVQEGREKTPQFEQRALALRQEWWWQDFLDAMALGPSNDLYMTAGNAAANQGPLAPLFHRLRPQPPWLRDQGGAGEFLWIGNGTRTPLHHDLTQNLVVQLEGQKRVYLVDPALQPRLRNTQWVYSDWHWLDEAQREELGATTLVLNPGDILFIPVGWWHQVEAPGFSVTATFTNFLWPNYWTEGFPP